MNDTSLSCKYIPSDTQKKGLPMIHGTNVSCVYEAKNNVVAVDQVDFSIEEGKITAIIGESGSGKSTLLKLIYGLLEPSSGEIRYKGWLVPGPNDKLIPGHDAMRMVSQGFDDLNHYAKVWDNIASQIPNVDLERKHQSTEKVLKKLRIDHLAQQRVADLSGGERQRVAIARALINEPEVLLMDEPFNQVDASFRDSLQQDVERIVAETGLTVILVSHDPSEVLAMADHMLIMRQGKIISSGSPQELYYDPKQAYTAQLLSKSNILTAEQAQSLGLDASSPVAIHQEWITFDERTPSQWRIADIRFRGLFYEYLLDNESMKLRAMRLPTHSHIPVGGKVQVNITRWVEMETK